MNKKTYAVIGLGKFGYSVAETLAKAGCEVFAVDGDNEKIQKIANLVSYPLCADVTEQDVLENINFKDVDVAVIGISDNMEASIIATLYVKEAGVPYVLVKANSALHGHILKKIGADEVVYPESSMGARVAKNFISGRFKDYFELSRKVSLVEMHVPSAWVGSSLIDLNLRKHYGINVVAVTENEGEMTIAIDPTVPLEEGQILGIIGDVDMLTKVRNIV